MDYHEELELAVGAAKALLPAGALGAATWSLNYGPSGGGAEMSWDAAIAALRDWADGIEDWIVEDYVTVPAFVGADCDEGDEDEELVEIGRIEAPIIVSAVLGAVACYL